MDYAKRFSNLHLEEVKAKRSKPINYSSLFYKRLNFLLPDPKSYKRCTRCKSPKSRLNTFSQIHYDKGYKLIAGQTIKIRIESFIETTYRICHFCGNKEFISEKISEPRELLQPTGYKQTAYKYSYTFGYDNKYTSTTNSTDNYYEWYYDDEW